MTMQEEISQTIERGDYSCYAIRMSEDEVDTNSKAGPSRRWHDGNPVNAYIWVDEDDVEALESEGYERIDQDSAEIMQANGYWGDGDALMINWDKYEIIEGTCGIMISGQNIRRSLETVKKYSGGYVILLAGNIWEEGNDRDEVIINNATVLGCWERRSTYAMVGM